MWNEPEDFISKRSQEQFFEAWVKAAPLIRQAYPSAKIAGPSLTGNADGSLMKAFLSYTQSQGIVTDIISWHANYASEEASKIESDTSDIRQWLDQHSIQNRQIAINEYTPSGDKSLSWSACFLFCSFRKSAC